MAFWIPLAIGAGLGAAKYAVDKNKEKRDRALQAATAKYSPWTGMAPQAVAEPSLLGNVIQGGTAGAMFGQQFNGEPQAANQLYDERTPLATGGWLEMRKAYPDYRAAAPSLYS